MKLSGVLFFPVTPFGRDGELDTDVLAEHIRAGLEHRPGGVFVACGTGEFSSLSADEHELAVGTAIDTVDGRVPVIAGAGGPLGTALLQAGRAAAAGVDGLLLMPPYLAQGPASGLRSYVEAVIAAAELPIILYQRGIVLEPADVVELARHREVVGFKDGLGDIDRMARIVASVRREIGDDFTFFNGLPTAELTVPAYRGIGVDLYSSAAFCFVPEVATAFRAALGHDGGEGGDRELAHRLITDFYAPLVELRGKVPGYAVSLVKAGVRLRGLDVGPVRPPLVDPSPEHLDELSRLIKTGLSIVGARA